MLFHILTLDDGAGVWVSPVLKGTEAKGYY